MRPVSVDGTRPYAVVDLDGVVADVRHRLHHIERRGSANWDAFFAAAGADPPLPEGFAVAQRLAAGHELVYLSGRPERCRDLTREWLDQHGAPPGQLLLRGDRDRRPARVMKLEQLRRLQLERPVSVLVDDDPRVCAAARAAGFSVLEATWADPDPQGTTTLQQAQECSGRS